MKKFYAVIACLLLLTGLSPAADKPAGDKPKDPLNSGTFMGLKLRCIGPAFTSGRIADLAVNPRNPSEYYVGVASGNLWKTVNSGTTWAPIFDNYGAYSIASVVIDPNNPHTVWVGTGEYNSQRAIGYGDGVYRSEDGGKSFTNMGLKNSEHIGRIVLDPRNSHVYVAVQGPLWGPGGDRGLYKSTDNGKTWKTILTISENTGITDIVIDPNRPDILYAAAYQRRRHVFTLINGGPESAIYKSTDAGATWKKVTSGLPGGNLGRIGLAISPVNPDVVYAIVEAEHDSGGFFRSPDRGETWEKMSGYMSRSPQYYNRIYCDPKDANKVYSLDTVSRVSLDGGKTWNPVGNKFRHVDDHACWIDPNDTRHLLIGGDGGIYETFDNGENWLFKCNLPVTQFYRISADNSLPFYYVYGGTQDNSSMGGPSRTINEYGIVNADWFITQGGDGFESQIDPKDPNIIYAQSQHGGLARFDKKSGESIDIQPQPPKGEVFRWNWNSPLIISPFLHTRLYFAANKLFRSDDRGNTWTPVSPDLTRQLDRNQLPVMGKIQPPDVPSKNASTSYFGNIVSLDESHLKEGLLYVGTDDGLIQVSEDGGTRWTAYEKFPGVPDMTYVSCLLASRHDADTVYASFDGRKNNDLKPYLLKSIDRGKTWQSLKADLPDRGTVYTIAQDHVNPDLLFAGTEFGAFFTIDGGKKWVQLKGEIPCIAVFDIAIQERENDLVLATFGRGIYILDDYTPLRQLTPGSLKEEGLLFPVKDALMFIQSEALYGQGSTYYAGKNPDFGATFTYYLEESLKSRKDKRKEAEKKALDKGIPITYPTFDQLRAEDEEEPPYLLFTVTDGAGQVVRRLKAPAKAGMQRITWDLRWPDIEPVDENSKPFSGSSLLAMPGKYQVSLGKCVDGQYTALAGSRSFTARVLENTSLPAEDRRALAQFQRQATELGRLVMGTAQAVADLSKRIKSIKIALSNTPAASPELMAATDNLEKRVRDIDRAFSGDETLNKRNENQPPAITDRFQQMSYGLWRSTSIPTQTAKDQYRIISEEYQVQAAALKQLLEVDLKNLEEGLDKAGAPWTEGRLPEPRK